MLIREFIEIDTFRAIYYFLNIKKLTIFANKIINNYSP